MNQKVLKLVQKLETSFNGEPWYGDSVLEKLERIDYRLVNRKPTYTSHTLARQVQHMINWRLFVIEKLKENEAFDIELNSSEDWSDLLINSKEEWGSLLEELNETQNQLVYFLNTKIDGFLEERVLGREYPFEYLIEGIGQHDTYHLGQIGLIEKLVRMEKVNMEAMSS